MKAEPGSFYLNIVDVFSIMLPGALLAYFLPTLVDVSDLGPMFQQPGIKPLDWLIFLLPSYLYGHFIFLASSVLDKYYDNIYRKKYFPEVCELEYSAAEVIKDRSIGEHNSAVIKTYQWAKALLILENPAAAAEVLRLEAASKFFRSLIVVFMLLIILDILALANISAKTGSVLALPVLAILIALSFIRYIERRHKSVKQACWFIISRDALTQHQLGDSEVPPNPSHAGGVVYKIEGESIKYLIVRPKSNFEEWLLPKGHIEKGETPSETAVREVQEEAGIKAKIIAPIGNTRFFVKDESVVAEFFLMEYEATTGKGELRDPLWKPPNEAIAVLSFSNYKHLLALGECKRKSVKEKREILSSSDT